MPSLVRRYPRPIGWFIGCLVVAAAHWLIIGINMNPGMVQTPEIFGFPMIFYTQGGAMQVSEFRPAALMVDIAWALAVPLFMGLHLRHRVDLWQRQARPTPNA